MFSLTPGTLLFDSAHPTLEDRQALLFQEPSRVLAAWSVAEVPALLRAIDEVAASGKWVAGYVAYEAGYAFESIAEAPTLGYPLAWLGVYDAPTRLRNAETDNLLGAAQPHALTNLTLGIEHADYLTAIAAVKHHIREGDVYQINFTDGFTFDFEGDPLGLYALLRQRQRVAYGALLHLDKLDILSLSPELFFRREGDRLVTRPMKGTVHRGRTLAEDQQLQTWLANDAKSQAENLMIVDLLRNDLSICCRPGSVTVPALFHTEPYETLIQMTSTVEGQLREGVGYAEIFRALFPSGSVTGAPKIRAMQRIHDLEAGPRGVYCGAIGYIAPHGEATFNVAIRTVVLQGGKGRMGTGSGIVWDSDPQAEYEECLLKGRFLTQTTARRPFQLIETMRSEDGVVPLLGLHADRLEASAAYFMYRFSRMAFVQAVERAASRTTGLVKVRATLDAQGTLELTTARYEEPAPGFERVLVADEPVDSRDVFCYHKTTRRAFYERWYRRAQAEGYDEVLFLNERGEVTEGSRTNVFIRNGETLVTPPIESGLLGGVYRRHVLENDSQAKVQVLTLDDLLATNAVLLCNAMRGMQTAGRVSTKAAHPVDP